jgi:ATP-dependent RNA helicase DDX19/DBP5
VHVGWAILSRAWRLLKFALNKMTDAPEDNNVEGAEEVAEPQSDEDRDAPDLSLKTPGLSESKNSKLKVELADGSDSSQSEFYSSSISFEDLGLSQRLLDGLYNEMGFKAPSSIQARTLPLIMAPPHRHLIAQGHNGCGKTTCFALAMLSR